MAQKILIVDDETDLELLIRQRFRRQIREGVFEFFFAHNGVEALEQLALDPSIEIVMSDINMPTMDGLTLLGKISELHKVDRRAVIVSAYGDLDNIRTAMNRGAFDFLTKPINFEDLDATISKTMKDLEVLKEGLQHHQQLLAIQSDLNVAKQIQQQMLPKFPAFPDRNDFEIFGAMITAKEVGGDFYDFFLIDEHHLGFVIADVSGKGVPAAMFMAISRTILRTNALSGLTAGECMERTNDMLCVESDSRMFVTVFYGILDTRTGVLEYANGGHNPPYILRAGGGIEMIPSAKNLVLGMMDEMPYANSSVSLRPNDVVFMFTDGVTEAMDIDNNQYTEKRLEDYLGSAIGQSLGDLVQNSMVEVKKFAGSAPQSDDITILAMRWKG